jgi:hypothetical protein
MSCQSVSDAISEGIDYTQHAIVTAEPKGEGHGPLNHGCIAVRRALSLYVHSNSACFIRAETDIRPIDRLKVTLIHSFLT